MKANWVTYNCPYGQELGSAVALRMLHLATDGSAHIFEEATMPKANFDQIDVRIDSHIQHQPPSDDVSDYAWPCKFLSESNNINPLISPDKSYKWHRIPLEEIPMLIGLVASYPGVDGRCMIFEIDPAQNEGNFQSDESVKSGRCADFTFIRYEYLIPSLSILSGAGLVDELMRHLKQDPLAIYCSARGFFWMRKQIQNLW